MSSASVHGASRGHGDVSPGFPEFSSGMLAMEMDGRLLEPAILQT